MSFLKYLIITLVAWVSCDHVALVKARTFGAVLTGSPDGRPGSYGLSNTYGSPNLGNHGFQGPVPGYQGPVFNGYNSFNHLDNSGFGTGYGVGSAVFSGLGDGAYGFHNYGAQGAGFVGGYGLQRHFTAGGYGLQSGIGAFSGQGTSYAGANSIGYGTGLGSVLKPFK